MKIKKQLKIADKEHTRFTGNLFKEVVSRITDGIVALDTGWHIVYINQKAAVIFNHKNIKDLIGKNIWTEYPGKASRSIYNACQLAMERQEPVFIKGFYKTINQWIAHHIYPSQEGLTIYLIESTGRKMKGQGLESDRFLFKTLMDNLPSSVFVKDKSYRKILFNSMHASSVAGQIRSMGLNLETEILGKTDFEVYPKELAEKYFADDQLVIRDGRTELNKEEQGINPEGEPIWLLVSKIPLRDKNGSINGMLGITTDITAQKHIEEVLKNSREELIKINRTQQILIKCNEILARKTGEEKLLDEICRIIVEVGRYSFAWVGYIEDNDIRSLRPVAQAGLNNDFLIDFKITDADVEQDYGLIVEAISSGKAAVLNSPVQKAAYSRWDQSKEYEGYTSVISIPLRGNEKTFGVLNVYSPQTDAFNCSGASLLNELTEDLSYGILTLRNQGIKIQTETTLQISEERLRQSVRVANLGIFDHDYMTNNVHWSDHLREIYGWNNREPITMSAFYNCIYPEDREKVIKNIKRAHDPAGEGRYDGEHRIVRRDGKIRWLKTRSQTYFRDDGDGYRPIRSVGAVLDITESKLAEQELNKLYVAIEQSPASVVITNANGEIEYVNSMFTKMSGFSSDEIKGKQLRILKKSKIQNKENQKIWDKLLSGSEWRGEYYNKNKNGTFYWESTLLSPIMNGEGKITNFLAIQENVSEKKKTLEELILAKEIAEEANRVKDVFLANMSHELRTPLIVVLGYSQLLEEVSTEPDMIKMAEGIRKGGVRLLNTLNSILDLTRIGSDRFELDIKVVDLLEEIKNIYDTFQEAASEKKIDYSIQILNNRLFTNTDQRIFGTILKNLIDNAIKFTTKGSVTIICGTETDQTVYVTVQDTGIGIAEEHQEAIFEEFHQVSEGINREYQGLGLGLAITRKYVEILGGKISVKSRLGGGSSFTIHLPSLN
jgi:PAS domain S-box-containing protein